MYTEMRKLDNFFSLLRQKKFTACTNSVTSKTINGEMKY